MDTKILIVDDEIELHQTIKDYLEDEAEFIVDLVFSGEEGIEKLDKINPDICIVDMRLPKMNGNDFIINVHEKLPGCKFIIHTGSIDYFIPAELSKIGMTSDSVIYKPVMDLAEFSNKIRKILQL